MRLPDVQLSCTSCSCMEEEEGRQRTRGSYIIFFNILYYILLSVLRQGFKIETAFQVVVAFYLLGKMMMEKSDEITKMRILSTSTSV